MTTPTPIALTQVILSTLDLNRIFQALHTEHARLRECGPTRVGQAAIDHAAELTERIRVHAVAAMDVEDPTVTEGTDERTACPSCGNPMIHGCSNPRCPA